jgi:hypothetical protein
MTAPLDRAAAYDRAHRHACKLLAQLGGGGAPGEVIEAVVSNGTVSVRVVVGSSNASRTPAGNGRDSSRTAGHLTRLDHEILAALADGPLTMAQLATALDGHDVDSYLRDRVKRLRRAGRVAQAGTADLPEYRLA